MPLPAAELTRQRRVHARFGTPPAPPASSGQFSLTCPIRVAIIGEDSRFGVILGGYGALDLPRSLNLPQSQQTTVPTGTTRRTGNSGESRASVGAGLS